MYVPTLTRSDIGMGTRICVCKLLLIAFACVAAVAGDVSHLPSTEYLPSIQDVVPVEAPVSNFIPEVAVPAPISIESAPSHILTDDGYRYKTHRRVVYRRNRRDVSHLPSNDYLPPVQEAAPAPIPVEAAPAHILSNDGYRYKTHRRVVYRRNRRDVSHLPSNDYLPPVQEAAPAPIPVEAAPAHILSNDGYRYKTNRRVVYRRNRRDVSHLPSNDYLPPVQEAPVATPLSNDGYRYKTNRRVVYRRNRRDVSHLPSNDYLPPVQETPVSAPVNDHILANDGYRYKTNRRVVYRRNRRDVSHLPSNDYLPPVQETPVAAPVNEYLPPVQQTVVAPAPVYAPAPVEAAPAHILTDDGYRYKTHRRVIYRRHDVSHLSNQYLPPQHAASAPAPSYSAPAPVYSIAASAPAPSYSVPAPTYSVAASAPAPSYSAPAPTYSVAASAPAPSYSAPAPSYTVAASAPAPSYSAPAPVYSVAASAPAPSYSAPAPSFSVAASAPAPSYSAPSVSYAEPEYAASEPAPAHSFSSADGYRYKTQRRVVYRHRQRRGAPSSEYLPPAASSLSSEYLPPAASAPAPSYSAVPEVSFAPAPSYQSESYAPAASFQSAAYAEPSYAESAPAHSFSSDDGYRYKTARRRVYRRRRF
ncbi:uncharacterized protein LOC129240446 [Anastrepha obliqua]|uniref:uncharacterized protein LOC129240446 n=1 Tax=Anastrepha obliqua TaxID=95512 RepID=UPI002409F2A8|nr:uncharacterized protein LOC129240446 [Anastrepha obliqua]